MLASPGGRGGRCRGVQARFGIGRKTGLPVAGGERWPAIGLSPGSVAGRHLSLLERRRIASLRGRGLMIREIASLLGQAPSTSAGAGAQQPSTRLRQTTSASNGPNVPDLPSCPRIPSSKQRFSLSWTRSGARSRSPPISGRAGPTVPTRTAVTKPSTEPSTKVPRVA
ncbi:helix-turn-helix domain-containing protein [Streptomyces sp. NPDC002547]